MSNVRLVPHPLSLQEQAAFAANYKVIIKSTDLTQSTVNTAQVFDIFPVLNKQMIEVKHARIVTPFSASADTAFNSTAITVGDSGSAARFLASQECNGNAATPVTVKKGTGTALQYTVTDTVLLTVNSMAAKALTSLDAGEVHIYLQLIDGTQAY